MTDATDLIARLRDWQIDPDELMQEAADALEAQARELEALRADAANFQIAYRLKCDEETKAQAVQIEALRADAERYRWLRDDDDDPVCSLRQLFTMTGKPKDVDAAVDAAMRKAVTL